MLCQHNNILLLCSVLCYRKSFNSTKIVHTKKLKQTHKHNNNNNNNNNKLGRQGYKWLQDNLYVLSVGSGLSAVGRRILWPHTAHMSSASSTFGKDFPETVYWRTRGRWEERTGPFSGPFPALSIDWKGSEELNGRHVDLQSFWQPCNRHTALHNLCPWHQSRLHRRSLWLQSRAQSTWTQWLHMTITCYQPLWWSQVTWPSHDHHMIPTSMMESVHMTITCYQPLQWSWVTWPSHATNPYNGVGSHDHHMTITQYQPLWWSRVTWPSHATNLYDGSGHMTITWPSHVTNLYDGVWVEREEKSYPGEE